MSDPILCSAPDTDFTSPGLGGLGACTSCRVTRQLNGKYELEMTYPIIGRRFRDLKNRNIILASAGPDEEPQPFRIYKTRLSLMLNKTVYARHIAYDLMGCPLMPFAAESLNAALGTISSAARIHGLPFDLAADFVDNVQCSIAAPRSAWAMLGGQEGSILDVYGGEWDFNRYALTLRHRLGGDPGVTVRYGSNIQSLQHDEDLANTWTHILPYWLSADGLTLVTLPEKRLPTGTFDYTRTLVWDVSAVFPSAPTEEQLRQRTQQYIRNSRVGEPDAALDVKWVPLDQTEEYKGKPPARPVHLGDTVTVEYPSAADPDTGRSIDFVQATARVVETVWLPMQDRYEYVRIGAKRANFATVMAQTTKTLDWVLKKIRR